MHHFGWLCELGARVVASGKQIACLASQLYAFRRPTTGPTRTAVSGELHPPVMGKHGNSQPGRSLGIIWDVNASPHEEKLASMREPRPGANAAMSRQGVREKT